VLFVGEFEVEKYIELNLNPNDSIMDYDNYDVNKLPPLSEEENKLWYSKYYYKGREELPEEIRKTFAVGNLLDVKEVLLLEKYELLTRSDYNEADFGYCLMENGCAYGATRSKLPNISYEMLEWFKSKCFTERIFYAMWYPGSHISEFDGNTIEDLGFGIEELERLGGLTWQDLGFNQNPADIDPSFLAIRGGNTYAHMQAHPEITPRAITLFHYVRKLDNGGIEFITHFYIGMHIINGKIVKKQSIEPQTALEIARRMVSHCAYERENLNSFLPELYERLVIEK